MDVRARRIHNRGLFLAISDLPSQQDVPSVYAVQYGMRQIEVPVKQRKNSHNILISLSMAKYLLLPSFMVNIKVQHGQIKLGPAVAIYALKFPGERIFGPQTRLFIDLTKIARSQGVDVFVVTPGQFDYDNQRAIGYRYDIATARWRRQYCPWPDVVIRRVTSRPARYRTVMEEDDRILADWTNQATLPRELSDKWLLHEVMQHDPILSGYMLPTYLLKRPEDIIPVVSKLHDIYVKPVRGTQGLKIARVMATDYGLEFRKQSQSDKGAPVISPQNLVKRMRAWFAGDQTFIAQRTVLLMKTLEGRPFDVRYLVQRDGDTIACTAQIARIGVSDALTTNIHTGAVAMDAASLTPSLRDKDQQAYQQGIETGKTAAMRAFFALTKLHPILMELGVDVAIDEAGRAFVLEVNPCPGRQMLRTVSSSLRMLSLLRMVEYAVFSTEFRI